METNNNRYYEICVYYNKIFSEFFLNGIYEIKSIFKDCCGVCVNISGESTNKLLIAVEDVCKNEVQQKVAELIRDFYLVEFKKNYFEHNIKKLYEIEEYSQLLVCILSNFDLDNDIVDLMNNLFISEKLYLREFFYFKLKTMEKRWREICELINENSFFFHDTELLFELFRFLLKSIKPKYDQLVLKFDNGIAKILDKDNNLLRDFEYQNDKQKNNILIFIINNLAKKIKVVDYSYLESDIALLLKNVFNNILEI